MNDTEKPSKTKRERLSPPYHFRLPESVAEVWDEKIAKSGMDASKFFRLAIIENKTVVQGDASGARKRAVRVKDNVPADVKKAIFLLAQLGNNMNQIAHRLNLDHKAGKVAPATYAAILEELRGLSATVKGWI
jgi:hypothetical protein